MSEYVAVGFDVGGTNIDLAIVRNEVVLRVASIPYTRAKGDERNVLGDELAAALFAFGESELEKIGLSYTNVSKIGVACAGSIDESCRVVVDAHNLGLHNVAIADELEKIIPRSIKIGIINDADAAAVGEHKFGVLRGYSDCCLVTIGTGIGAGVIIGGSLYRGGKRRGTEIGHMTLSIKGGEMCTCGNDGCFEANCSATFLKNRAIAAFSDERMTAKKLVEMARAGDTVALAVFDEYVNNLGYGLASIMNVIDPQIIAIGGGVSLAGDFLLEPLKEQVKKRCFFTTPGELAIAQLKENAGAIGAASI